jgi:hypothetical protein
MLLGPMPANLVPDAAVAPRGERNDRRGHYADDEAGTVLPCISVWRHWSIMAAAAARRSPTPIGRSGALCDRGNRLVRGATDRRAVRGS